MDAKLKVGIIGGGQLGMMTLQEADVNAAEYTILESSNDCPAFPYAQHFIQGSLKSETDIQKLASVSDVVTWEIEHIHVDALLNLEAQGKNIIPRPRVLKIIQDKGLQKQFFVENRIPTAPFLLVANNELKEVDWTLFPETKIVVKTRTGGYDGKGVAICEKSELLSGNCPFEGNILLERFVENALELAVIVAVDQHGNSSTFPSIEMYFNPSSNLVEFLYSPAQISPEIEIKCREIAETVVNSFNSPGLFAVELFVTSNGEVLVNEIAPRPHNSGHHTIEGCVTSQFAQLNRILLGKNLGDTALKCPSAMLNIVGPDTIIGSYCLENEDYWNGLSDVFVHMYGKSETRPNRKLGHVTVLAESFEKLIVRAEEVKNQIRIIPS